MPHLEKFRASLPADVAKDLVIVSLTDQSDLEMPKKFGTLQDFRQNLGVTYPFARYGRAFRDLFPHSGIPTNYVIGRDGVLRYVDGGFTPQKFAALRKSVQGELRKKVSR
ncbi:MAG: hypothetical protein HY540_03955 [Deltaproteobacteria bacterium]|nr:hypothetical protein [Deltaproteobacteria bacterium]